MAADTELKVTIAGLIIAVIALVIAFFAWIHPFSPSPTPDPALSTLQMTLQTLCDAAKRKDYLTAYNVFGSDIRKSVSETNFASNSQQDARSRGWISSCTVSGVEESGSTAIGKITFTYDDGTSDSANYTMTNDNGDWRITG